MGCSSYRVVWGSTYNREEIETIVYIAMRVWRMKIKLPKDCDERITERVMRGARRKREFELDPIVEPQPWGPIKTGVNEL